jgi:hypothetical protein
MEKYLKSNNKDFWTNRIIKKMAGNLDPIIEISEKAKLVVLKAIEDGWQGPPFDPFKLAEILRIQVMPNESVPDARLVTIGDRVLIEFNPNRSRGRINYSIAHEIAHTFFPNYGENIKNRLHIDKYRRDDWQVELLCNVAASELIMPIGNEIDRKSIVNIDTILMLQKKFDVSTEAISIRVAKVTLDACTVFSAARVEDDINTKTYRIDYCIPSRTSEISLPKGLLFNNSVLSDCTAIGFTAKGSLKDILEMPELKIECVGIPAYPGRYFPRIIGLARAANGEEKNGLSILMVRGDALKPRGKGPIIIAQIVNDKTPNWGAGFAKSVKARYPSVQGAFIDWINQDKRNLLLGNIHIAPTEENVDVVSMVAQHGYGPSTKPRIRYVALKRCLEQLKDVALKEKASVHMPRIGTGFSGGNWNIVAELVDETLVRNGVNVTVYSLPNKELDDVQSRFVF